MEFTRTMQCVMERAVGLARENHHRYFMPEHMIYGMTFDEDFSREYEAAGGKIDKLRMDLLSFLKEQAGTSEAENAVLTADTDRVLRMSEGQARASGRRAVDVSHLLAAVLLLEDSYGVYYLTVQDVNLIEIAGEMSRESLRAERGEEHLSSGVLREEIPKEIPSPADRRFREFLEDMNETCQDKNPLIGREKELERTIQILCRKDKNNVLHVGEPGVGKTALAYGLARKIVAGDVPEPLKGARM